MGKRSLTKRILIYELNWLGDILFSFPLMRAIKEAYPDVYLACCVVPRYGDLLVNNPSVDEVLYLSDRRGVSSLLEKAAFVGRVRSRGFDACILLKPSKTKAMMARLAGIPERIGFAGKKSHITREVAVEEGATHRIDQLLRLVSHMDNAISDNMYVYHVPEKHLREAERLVERYGKPGNRLIAVNPGGNWDAKRWPAGNFADLARGLIRAFPDVNIMVTGAKKDVDLAARIVDDVGGERCFSVAGLTDLNLLAALFGMSDLVISADSGPLHLASASGSDTIGLFGPTSEKVTGPRGKGRNVLISHEVGCRIPCYVEKCGKGHECMKAITVDEVLKVAKKMMGHEDR